MNATNPALPPWSVNGQVSDCVSVNDRAVQFGDGLFETMRVVDTAIPLLSHHMVRLEQGCQRLGILLDVALLLSNLQQYLSELAATKPYTLKLIVSRGEGTRGYRPQATTPTIAMRAYPYSAPTVSQLDDGVHARLCVTPLGCNPVLAGMKHLNRIEQVLARAEWDDEHIFEGLMQDVNGHLIEGTMTNVFFVRDRTVFTPELSECGVAGVMREELLGFFAQHNTSAPVQGRFNFQDLEQASEVFISNSLIGVLSLRTCEHLSWEVGPVALMAREHINNLFAKADDYESAQDMR